MRHRARQAVHQQLISTHTEHLELIQELMDMPDRVMTDTPLPRAKGTLGEVAQAALHTYFYHALINPEGIGLRVDAAQLVPKLFSRFPYLDSRLTVGILENHPNLTDATAKIIHDAFAAPKNGLERGPFDKIAELMIGFHSRRDDPFQKNGQKIMARALADAADWPRDQLTYLANVFALNPLKLNIGTAEEEAQKALNIIARAEARLAIGFNDPDSLIPSQLDEQMTREGLEAAKSRLRQIETDFDSVIQNHFETAAKHLARANNIRKTVEIIVRAMPEDAAAALKAVLAEADVIKSRPSTFPMPKASENRFKDFGFKLMVIDELMYAQKRLLPLFDIRKFAKEWTKREISIEDDGDEIIPEAQKYFKNLPISDELLSHVKVLTQKSGLDGGGGVIEQMFPFWDPGVGDGPIPITNKAVADLNLLPNLERIVGLEHEVNKPIPRKLLQELEKRGIETVSESIALWGKD